MLEKAWNDYDFFFVHFKYTDSRGEDGNFAEKVKMIEQFDAIVPRVMALKPTVLVVTGDHSTPAKMKSHSWHPVPVLLAADNCRPDGCQAFGETRVPPRRPGAVRGDLPDAAAAGPRRPAGEVRRVRWRNGIHEGHEGHEEEQRSRRLPTLCVGTRPSATLCVARGPAVMTNTQDRIQSFLAQGPYAVVGASRDRSKYGNKVLRAYQQRGLPVFPVNPERDRGGRADVLPGSGVAARAGTRRFHRHAAGGDGADHRAGGRGWASSTSGCSPARRAPRRCVAPRSLAW